MEINNKVVCFVGWNRKCDTTGDSLAPELIFVFFRLCWTSTLEVPYFVRLWYQDVSLAAVNLLPSKVFLGIKTIKHTVFDLDMLKKTVCSYG